MNTITTTIQPNITSTEAKLELMILNSQTNQLDWVNMATLLHSRGAPLELVTRMENLWEKTKIIAGKVVNIGRVIIMKIWEFIKANPHMVIGAAFGALVGLIPFIGPLLAPIAMTIGITIGVLQGHRLDKIAEGQRVQYSIIEDLITVAKRFFHLIADIFLALRDEYFANGFSS